MINGVFYLDANARYTVWREGSRNLELFMNVRNLLDKEPPFVPATGANAHVAATGRSLAFGYTNLAYYDFIGRTYLGRRPPGI